MASYPSADAGCSRSVIAEFLSRWPAERSLLQRKKEKKKEGKKTAYYRLHDRRSCKYSRPFLSCPVGMSQTPFYTDSSCQNPQCLVGNVERGQVGAIALLSLAFDTVDHVILFTVRRKRFGVTGPCISVVPVTSFQPNANCSCQWSVSHPALPLLVNKCDNFLFQTSLCCTVKRTLGIVLT